MKKQKEKQVQSLLYHLAKLDESTAQRLALSITAELSFARPEKEGVKTQLVKRL